MARTAVLAESLIAPYREHGPRSLREAAPYLRDLRIHELGMSGPVHEQLVGLPGFTFSELFDGVPQGTPGPGGVRCEDVERLTYADGTFDLFISQDVFEHVTDPDAGFREILRVLRPGGRHVFTVPYDPALPATRVRARRRADGTIEHLHPAAYHLDPIRREGALVVSDFGADLADRLRAIGFAVAMVERRLAGVPGGYTVVFDAMR